MEILNPIAQDSNARERNPILRPDRLTGADIALPNEDAAAIDKLADDLARELAPTTTIGLLMIEQMVLATIRSRRCARFERATTSNTVRDAVPRFEEERLEDVEVLMQTISSNPEVITRRLCRKPEGIDRMILEWRSLAKDLDDPENSVWSSWHIQKGDDLLGHFRLKFPGTRFQAVSKCLSNDFSYLEPDDCPGMTDAQKKDWARVQVREIIAAEIARLETRRATIDLNPVAGAKADATDAGSFDPSKAAAEARKYQSACNRTFHKSLATLREAETAAKATQDHAATQAQANSCRSLGSFLPGREASEQTPGFSTRPAVLKPRTSIPTSTQTTQTPCRPATSIRGDETRSDLRPR